MVGGAPKVWKFCMLHVEVFLLTSLTRFLLSKRYRQVSESVSKTARNVYSVRTTAPPLIRFSTSKLTKVTNVKNVSNCRSSLSFLVSAEQYEVVVHQSEQRIPVRQSGRPTRFQNGIPVKIGGDRTKIERCPDSLARKTTDNQSAQKCLAVLQWTDLNAACYKNEIEI